MPVYCRSNRSCTSLKNSGVSAFLWGSIRLTFPFETVIFNGISPP